MRNPRFFAHAILLMLIFTAGAATADDCYINGVSTAEPNPDDPLLGTWKYTITIDYDTGSNYGVSHIDLLLDEPDNCLCEDFDAGLAWVATAGYFYNDGDVCQVDLMAMLECKGDPSLDLVEPMLKFEYDEEADCEPGPAGTAVIYIYSFFGPAPIAEPNMFLVDKHAQLACTGEITGVFPGLPCDPVPDATHSWGAVKSLYGR